MTVSFLGARLGCPSCCPASSRAWHHISKHNNSPTVPWTPTDFEQTLSTIQDSILIYSPNKLLVTNCSPGETPLLPVLLTFLTLLPGFGCRLSNFTCVCPCTEIACASVIEACVACYCLWACTYVTLSGSLFLVFPAGRLSTCCAMVQWTDSSRRNT